VSDRTEEEQIEAIKQWWKENGSAVILGVIIGVGSLVGWRGWNSYQDSQARAASSLYQEMQTAQQNDDSETIKQTGQQILNEYGGTPYAAFAAMALARQAVNADDLATAEKHLRLALNTLSEPSLQHVARLRLLQVLTAADKHDEALAMIDSTKHGEFTAQYEEIRGDILLAQNQPDAARQAYQLAMSNSRPQAPDRDLLEMKLENLGGDASGRAGASGNGE